MKMTTDDMLAVQVRDEDVEQALEAKAEHAFLQRVHPDLSERILHRMGECDGSCALVCE